MTRYFLDTRVLLWTASQNARLPTALRGLMALPDSELIFSTASIWEVAIKHARQRGDFTADPVVLRRGLLGACYVELPALGAHAVAVPTLTPVHKDPFDRLLVAQAIVQNTELLTVDAHLDHYPGPIRVL